MKAGPPLPDNLGDMLLASGAVEGPYHPTRPVRTGALAQLLRSLRVWRTNRRKVIL